MEYRSLGQSSRGAHWFYSSILNGVRRFVHTGQKMLALRPSRRRTSQVHRALRMSYLGLGQGWDIDVGYHNTLSMCRFGHFPVNIRYYLKAG